MGNRDVSRWSNWRTSPPCVCFQNLLRLDKTPTHHKIITVNVKKKQRNHKISGVKNEQNVWTSFKSPTQPRNRAWSPEFDASIHQILRTTGEMPWRNCWKMVVGTPAASLEVYISSICSWFYRFDPWQIVDGSQFGHWEISGKKCRFKHRT